MPEQIPAFLRAEPAATGSRPALVIACGMLIFLLLGVGCGMLIGAHLTSTGQSTPLSSSTIAAAPHAPMQTQDNPDGPLTLSRQIDNHFHASGALNGVPTDFLIDTGATRVAISAKLAARANIACHSAAITDTANGLDRQACNATISHLKIGGFQFFNVDVVVSPNMSERPLLGMNVLDKFRLLQTGGQLTLSF